MVNGRLEIIPLGGLGEFGMNMMAFRYGDEMIIVDAGMMFPEDDLLGVDVIIPDLTFIEDNANQLLAVVLTHSHEDHIGALPFLLKTVNVPVYGTRFTLAMAENRLQEHGLMDSVLTHVIEPREIFEVGSFKIEFIHVSHSTTDCVALAIATPVGVIIHTGDFKVDETPVVGDSIDLETLRSYGDRGVLALLSDSTNIERKGRTLSERAVIPALEDIFDRALGRIIISCFTSSIHRIQIVFDLADQFGRSVALLGRSMVRNIEIADSLRFLDIPPEILVTPAEAKRLPREDVVLLVTGCQGEPMAALARMAVGNHKHATVEKDDTVVLSSRIIPGNERSISRMINHLCKLGAHVYDERSARVHVSGHGSQEDLQIMLEAVRPRFLIPIHGEYRQLFRHKEFAVSLGFDPDNVIVAESGDVIEIDEHGARITAKVFVGRTFIDSSGFGELEDMVIRDRKHLAYDGIVLPVVAINMTTGALESEPELITRGFVSDGANGIIGRAREVVAQTVEGSEHEERIDPTVMKEKIRIELKRFIQRETRRRPMIIPVIVEI